MGIARWWKVDFHTHTPASRCFKNYKEIDDSSIPEKIEYAKKWLEKAKENNIDAVAITDHNSVEWIQYIRSAKEELEKMNVQSPEVFPGVELSVNTQKIHILVIFDKDITQENLNSFMSMCNIMNSNFGDTNQYITEDNLINAINRFKNEHNQKMLIIPAHYSKEKGAGKLLTDTNVLQTFISRLGINAIEIRDENDDKKVQDHIKKGIIPNVATITGSDNPDERKGHSINGIGSKYTWIKMSEISIEGIRQSLLDPESRIKKVVEVSENESDPNKIEHNYIAGISIKDLKHIKDVDIRFSPNLNCIVGPRGSGKSTIIESLKVMLGETQIKDTNILAKTYESNSDIKLYYKFGDTSEYLISCIGNKNNFKLEVESDSEKKVTNPPNFNATIFGQKEIYNLVEDEGNIDKNESSPILKQIDSNIVNDKIDIESSISNKVSEIESLLKNLENSKKKLKNLPQIKSEVEKTNNKLEKFRTTGVLEKKERLDKLSNKYTYIQSECKQIYENKNNLINQLLKSIDEYKEIELDSEELIVLQLNEKIKSEIEIIQSKVRNFNDDIQVNFISMSESLKNSELKCEINKTKSDYNLIINENKEIDVNKYNEVVTEDKRNRDNLLNLEIEIKNVEEYKVKIEENIDKYIMELKKLTDKRKDVVDEINSKSKNIILSIDELSHGDRWIKEIRKDLGKKDSYTSQFNLIYDKILPQGKIDIEMYKKWLKFLLTTETGDIREVVEDIKDQKFIDIWIGKYKSGTLSSLFKISPEDKVNINIVNGRQSINITEGSPGQKSASILAFILSQGEDPLIIDQPEDDLDNSLIIKLVVDNIRRQKINRQIIIVTHNPNIPVLGDAEGIIMLDRDDNGTVSLKCGKKAGCIEEKTIKNGICDIMEGGIDAFKRRENKYKNMGK